MRITEKIISNGLTRNIHNTMRRIDKRYDELSSGKKIRYPSDDPVGLITSLRLKNAITEADRYKDNSETAISWLDASDAALNEETSVLHRLEELGVAAGNSPLTDSSRKAIADEVHELKNICYKLPIHSMNIDICSPGKTLTPSPMTIHSIIWGITTS